MEDDAADELDIVMALAQSPLGGLAHDGESLGKDIVQSFAAAKAFREFQGLALQFRIRKLLRRGLEGVHLRHNPVLPLHKPVISTAKKRAGQLTYHFVVTLLNYSSIHLVFI